MANLILTTDCQRKCSYCFAKDSNVVTSFSWQNFLAAEKFINTGPKIVNLMGGEPTLHPDFIKILKHLISNDYTVQVFTNGMLSDQLLEELIIFLNDVRLKDNQLYFAINIRAEKYRQRFESDKQINFLKSVKDLAYPAFTIHEKDTNLLFLVDLIEKYGLDHTIRMGLALPVINGDNDYLPQKFYKNVAKSIIDLANNSDGITITFDCGFPLCMFTLDDIAKLSRDEENDFMFSCGQPIDIYPDLTVTNCYPLSKVHKTNITNFKDITELYTYFREGFITPTGIYNEQCNDCTFFRKVCGGGCKGFYKK